ncbi:DISARM system phospholipase D-like protein DrmC [Streptomyces sp. NPDC001110]|uniref:DISARM system phospholipase D-like protein DrmC n=1 Tax=Streptomyces sp. M3 TaxID=295102 RepID=UPI0013E8FB99|nr:DISARM system phospholipase D-like protein DrmC [Streptomyces sp. M3]
MTPPNLLEELAAELAEQLPPADIEQLARACRKGRPGLRALEAQVAGIAFRTACRRLRSQLSSDADGGYAAGLLTGAAQARRSHHFDHRVDVVWTGPASAVHTSRLTSAVVGEIIDSARTEILLVSYASYPPASLSSALSSAADRGVGVTLLLENQADNPKFHGNTGLSNIPATRLTWPVHRRENGAALHAKIIVVDRRVALVGSANLTSHAFEKNLECGILLRDVDHARAIALHLDSLRETGELMAGP